jgi:hypothetical protein
MKMKSLFLMVSILFVHQFIYAGNDTIPHIKNIPGSVVIDGNMDEIWNSLDSYAITYLINGLNYPSASDCSGYFKACWNNDSLFLMIYGIDDVISTNSANPWENDGFEVYFDMDNSKDTVYKKDNYQFRFNLNSSDITGTNGNIDYNPPTVNFAIKSYPEHYSILEVVFPLVELGMAPSVNNKYMGFDVQILDNDGAGREAAMAWHNNQHEAYFNPSKMGTVYISSEIISSVNSNSLTYKIYPNPVRDYLNIASDLNFNDITIRSIDGKICLVKRFDNVCNQTIDLSKLNPGIYFLKINYASNKKDQIKIIKN